MTNLSQQLISQTLQIASDVWADLDQTMIGPDLNAASHDLGLTGVLLLDDIVAQQDHNGDAMVTIQASRTLTDAQLRIVQQRIEGSASGRIRQ